MKKIKPIKRENVWLGCMTAGPLTAFLAVFHPALIILSIILLIIGIKGVKYDML